MGDVCNWEGFDALGKFVVCAWPVLALNMLVTLPLDRLYNRIIAVFYLFQSSTPIDLSTPSQMRKKYTSFSQEYCHRFGKKCYQPL